MNRGSVQEMFNKKYEHFLLNLFGIPKNIDNKISATYGKRIKSHTKIQLDGLNLLAWIKVHRTLFHHGGNFFLFSAIHHG